MFRVIMAKGRRLKKVGGDLKVQKRNVALSKLTIGKNNVVPSELKVDVSSNPCGIKLAMVVVCNSNDEVPSNIDWEF
jgi:hypothetical protein